MIVSATGHRPAKLDGYGPAAAERRRRVARAWLSVVQPSRGIVGMALGWDQDIAHVCVELGIPFTATVPFVGQERAWPQASQLEFARLLHAAADVVIVSPGGYSVGAMHARNHWMVDHADLVCALWDGSEGGTAGCIKYAKRVGRPMVNLWSLWLSMENK